MAVTENLLMRLFDFQRFQGNERLEKLILQTEQRCGLEGELCTLPDESLEVWAAGDVDAMRAAGKKDESESDGHGH